MPRVSVIMPARDRAWVLCRAVESVLAQTMPDLELVVIDDGSTDGTADLLDRTDDPRLVRAATPGLGAAAARNAGLARARADLVAYLDTDNVWHPHFLEVLCAELAPTDVLAYCGQHLFLVDGPREAPRVVGRRTRSLPWNPAAQTTGSFVDTNTVLHRRAVLAEVGGFDETLPRLHDWDLFARIAARHPFAVRHVDQVLCDYYLYLRATAPTLTNAALPDAALLAAFGLETDPTGRAIRAKLDRLLGRSPGMLDGADSGSPPPEQEDDSMGTRAVPPALSATDTVEADRDAEGTVGHTDDAARSSTGDDLLRFAGTWEGDDLEACLDLVYATRSQARF